MLTVTVCLQEVDRNISIQYSNSSSRPQMYYEGIHWVKGPLLGTGAFSTCYQARDTQTGVIMAVKQVRYMLESGSNTVVTLMKDNPSFKTQFPDTQPGIQYSRTPDERHPSFKANFQIIVVKPLV